MSFWLTCQTSYNALKFSLCSAILFDIIIFFVIVLGGSTVEKFDVWSHIGIIADNM